MVYGDNRLISKKTKRRRARVWIDSFPISGRVPRSTRKGRHRQDEPVEKNNNNNTNPTKQKKNETGPSRRATVVEEPSHEEPIDRITRQPLWAFPLQKINKQHPQTEMNPVKLIRVLRVEIAVLQTVFEIPPGFSTRIFSLKKRKKKQNSKDETKRNTHGIYVRPK